MVRVCRVVRFAVALVLVSVLVAGCGGTSTEKLLERLSTTTDSGERASTAKDLAGRRDVDATARLVQAAAGSEIASAGLVALRDACIEALAIEDAGTEEAEGLCSCLAAIADDQSVDAIAAHIGMDPYGGVPAYAVSALGSTGTEHAAGVLASIIETGPAEALPVCTEALKGMPDVIDPVMAARSRIAADDFEGRGAALDDVLASKGEAAAEPLLKQLTKADWPIRTLARLGNTVAEDLAVLARDGKKAVRLRAQKTLVLMYSLDKEAASKALLKENMVGPIVSCRKQSDDEYPDEYSALCDDVLAAMGKNAVPKLVGLLGEEYWTEDVLARIGKPAVKPVMGKLESGSESVRFSAADTLVQMQKNDPDLVAPLMAELKDKNLRYIADKYAFYIRLGKDGSEKVLIQALNQHGNADMCVDYLNCGNSKLESAAEDWANSHGYYVYSTPGFSGGPQWGAGE